MPKSSVTQDEAEDVQQFQSEQVSHAPSIHSNHRQEIQLENAAVLWALDPDDEKGSNIPGLKLAKDGKTILIPQPSDDPNDPLNWTSFKKHMVLLLVAFGAFAGDFGASAGVPTIVLQGIEWNMSPVVVNYATNLAVIMCGISGLLWMPLLNFWGRMPVLFWSSFLGVGFTIGCALSPNFPTFYGMRALQCVTQSTGQTIGLAFVKDLFFFHEHARKIGLWYAVFICSPFFSPLLGNFMIAGLGQWRPVFWMIVGWAGFVVCLILVYGDESYYNRSVPVDQQPERRISQMGRLSRVLGIWQIKSHRNKYFPGLIRSYARLLEVFFKPVIPMAMLFYAMIFMWSVGINITSSILLETPVQEGGYGFGPNAVGFMFFTPIIAILMGEAFGHYFNDYIASRYVKKHHGIFVPEVRLWTNYIGLFLMVPGLVLVGQTLQRHLHWVGIVFGWGLFQVGVMLVSVATVAYVLDCYPTASGEVSALINLGRVGAGFSVGYFQMEWGLKQGFDVSFGLQAVVVVGAFILLVFIQRYGAKLRVWAGPIKLHI